MRFSKIAFFVFLFYVGDIETEKIKKMEKAKKTIKIGFFKVVIQKCENQKNGFFAKLD